MGAHIADVPVEPSSRTLPGQTPETGAVAEPLTAYLWTLSGLPDGAAVGFALCKGLLAPYDADLALVYAARSDGELLDLVAQYGMEPASSAVYSVLSRNLHLPGAESFRVGREQWLSKQDVLDNYPLAAPFFRHRSSVGEFGFLPLRHRGAPIGFIVLGFPRPVDRTWHFRAAIDGLLSGTVLWMLTHTTLHGTALSHLFETPLLEMTPRQREVLVHLRDGRSVAAIAKELGYSPSTVKADISHMSSALGASGRDDLLDRARRAGL